MSKKQDERKTHKVRLDYARTAFGRPNLCLTVISPRQKLSADWKRVTCKRCRRKGGRR